VARQAGWGRVPGAESNCSLPCVDAKRGYRRGSDHRTTVADVPASGGGRDRRVAGLIVHFVHSEGIVAHHGPQAETEARPSPRTAAGPHVNGIIRDMARGDRAALERFYDRHGQLVYNLVLRIVRNRADAEEVVQEVFLQAWRTASRYDPSRGTAEAWLVTLARSRAIDALRAARRGWPEETGSGHEIADPAPGEAARFAERHGMAGALGELVPAQRELLELAYYAGLTQSEIAARTGLPLGTVKTRMRTGLEQLRQALEGREWVAP
jgi:RNA polymerase sigma-70 factor, ECF subfamily